MGIEQIRILVAIDDVDLASTVEETLHALTQQVEDISFDGTCVRRLQQARDILREGDIDVILSATHLADAAWAGIIAEFNATAPSVPIIIVAPPSDEVRAREAVAEGALEYILTTELDVPLLRRSIRYSIEIRRMQLLQRALTEALNVLADVMDAKLSIDEVLHQVLQALARVIPYNRAAILVSANGYLTVRALRGFPDRKALLGVRVRPESNQAFFDIMRSRETISLADIRNAANYDVFAAGDTTRAWLGVPLLSDDEVFGVLALYGQNPGQYTWREVEIVQTFADQLAIALENTRLSEQTQEALAKTEALYQAARSLIVLESLPDVLQAVVDGVAEVLPVSWVTLIAFDVDARTVKHFVKAGTRQELADVPLTFEEMMTSVRGDAVRTKEAILLSANDAGMSEADTPVASQRSLIAIPLLYHDEIVGTLTATNAADGPEFAQRDVEIIGIMGRQAAVAIKNARLFDEMKQLAITDELTGVHNRRHFFSLARREYERARRFGHRLSALMVDIDHFKDVNDTHGHAIGDQILRKVAQRLQNLRAIDLLGRYGGEEFAIVLPETDLAGAWNVASRLREHIAATPISTDDGGVRVTVSVGIATLVPEIADLETLIDRADDALYEAKQAGRNRVEAWEPAADG